MIWNEDFDPKIHAFGFLEVEGKKMMFGVWTDWFCKKKKKNSKLHGS